MKRRSIGTCSQLDPDPALSNVHPQRLQLDVIFHRMTTGGCFWSTLWTWADTGAASCHHLLLALLKQLAWLPAATSCCWPRCSSRLLELPAVTICCWSCCSSWFPGLPTATSCCWPCCNSLRRVGPWDGSGSHKNGNYVEIDVAGSILLHVRFFSAVRNPNIFYYFCLVLCVIFALSSINL